MNSDQEIVKKFVKENDLESSIESRLIDLVSKLGELAKEINLSSNYGKTSINKSDRLLEELGDVYYSLLTVAEYFDEDISVLLKKVIEKYQKRLKKGRFSSSNV